ncbi:adenylate/guanylate cyclase domain-containing protein [Nodosilinea nodulosa]|uniref:WD40 domain-containing protein n=1 Tax=Nodosilinea nodulosa TaxID=416001 RepID=UPI00030C4D3B|nr:adenylate/guanylate cyclase domain-containing protein [Nodosilinea nodulosa]
MSLATVSNFLTGKPVDRAIFLELCEKLSLNSSDIADLNSDISDRPVADPDPEPSHPLSQRTLAAIVFTDVVSFTQRMSDDELHTLLLVQRDFQQMEALCQQFAGRVLKHLGDGLLLYFNSAEQAVLCAIAIQQALATATNLSPENALQHRIGIDLGDVVHSDDDVMGNSVNLAARLQSLAVPGGICLSQSVYDVVSAHLPIPVTYGGKQAIKGLEAPLPIYHIAPPAALSSPPSPSFPSPLLPHPSTLDWGEAMDVSVFYGRTAELATLERWIVQEGCRLVTLLGLGGVGKSALSVKLAEQIQAPFAVVIWRSLRNAPPLADLLADLLMVLSDQQEIDLPEAIEGRITRLIAQLQRSRCLLVLDNVESILSTGDQARAYRAGYDTYGQLFRRVGESRHQSCLVLTSREMPGGLATKTSHTSPIRSLRLGGLGSDDAQAILRDKGVAPLSSNLQLLIERYSGNPLALKIVSTTIQEVFGGDVAQFLEQGTVVFGDISNLLEQQFNRLTGFEQQVMLWLAIAREGRSLAELRADILPLATARDLLESLESLQQRSLIEKATSPGQAATFTQQPVVMEYVTERLINQICNELIRSDIGLLDSLALSQAQTKDYLRNAQYRLILQPILAHLQQRLGGQQAAQACLDQTLALLKARPFQTPGYGAGNLLNLLNQMGVSLSGYDFSHLPVWQVYLQGVDLQGVNFAHADLSQSVFTQTMGDVLAIDFSPDGSLLAMGIDRQILLWRMGDRRQIATLEGHTAWVRCVAFSPDGQTLASGSLDHTIRLWDVQTGQCLKTLRGHTSDVQSIAFSLDGTLLASGSKDHTVRLWDVQTQQCLKTLTGHCSRLLKVIFAADQTILMSTSDDQTVRFWDLASGDCLQTIETHVNWLLSAALSPNGTTLAVGSDHQTVKFWDVQTGECLGTLPGYSATVWAVAFSPDGQQLATGSDDKTIRLWDMQTRQCLKTWQEHTNQVWQVSFSPDGQTLVSGGEDQAVKLWDVASGHCLTTITSHRNWVAAIAFSPDGRTLASGSKDQQIRLWDVESGLCTKTQPGHRDVVTAIAFRGGGPGGRGASGAERILATGSDDHTIKLWNAQTLDCVKTLYGHDGWVSAIAFSPDGQTLVSGSSDKTVKLWNVRSGECLQTLEGHTQRVKSVAFHPQGAIIASGSDDHTVKLWDVATGNCVQTLAGHTDWVLSVAFSPDGQLVASGSGDRTIKLWDLQTGNCVRTLEGHGDRVRSIAFSPICTEEQEGNVLASGSEDCSVKLWNMQSGACLQTLTGHDQIVWMVTFNHNGQQMASCSDDGTIYIWDSKTGERLKVLTADRPYEGMVITGAVGLTAAQQATLCALGAIVD